MLLQAVHLCVSMESLLFLLSYVQTPRWQTWTSALPVLFSDDTELSGHLCPVLSLTYLDSAMFPRVSEYLCGNSFGV